MVICAMVGCHSTSGRDKTGYFCIPTVITGQCERTKELSTKRRALWLTRINRANVRDESVSRDTRVCGNHFLKGEPAKLFEENDPDWAPTLSLGYESQALQVALFRHARFETGKEKRQLAEVAPKLEIEAKRRKEEEATILEIELSRQEEDERIVRAESVPGISCQTDVTVEWINQLECKCSALETDNNALRAEVERLRTVVRNYSLDENDLAQDDVKVKFYTGLSTFTLFMHVFTLIAPKIETSHRNALSKLQEFLMTLMRLRLNLLEQDLAYRFGVTQPTVSSICEKWIRVMSVRLEKLIVWPEREVLRKTMPTCFREAFGTRVAVIIDCFEIFAQRPSSLLSRAETWSQYKHHNTVKVLIAITPQGTVSFTSLAWVGRASDKFITNKCGFLEKLIPGDVVLADRGFDISESVGMYRANLHIPAFTKGKTQLSFEDVQETRTIANVRIHVERVIGLLRRKYRILQGPLPTESLRCRSGDPLAPIDRIIRVCCGLTNLCPSVVGDDEYEPLPLPPRE